MTVLQLRGSMGLRVLQWCHPTLAYAKRASYCTRIITLYGARKGDSGPRKKLNVKCMGRVGLKPMLEKVSRQSG